jgi:deoxyribodipyrimidine photo-lyase
MKTLTIIYPLPRRPSKNLLDIIDRNNITAVYWNRCYEPWRIKRDTEIKSALESKGISVFTYNGSLLWEPWTIKKDDGTPYKVFTPFIVRDALTQKNLEDLYPKSVLRISLLTMPLIKS